MTTQTVNIDINANTQDAEQQVSRLENNIKTLDGAINLVGGSIEVLAGGLAITGAVTEEQAERFQSAAVGAIALADGSKRIIEGYKTLATETKVLTVVQRIYNTVMAANPLFLIVGVIAAVTVGVIALTKALKNQREEQEKINQLEADQTALRLQERSLKLAELRGESATELAQRQVDIAKSQSDIARSEYLLADGTEEKAAAQQKYNAAWDNYLIALEKQKIAIKESEEVAATQADMQRTRQEGVLELKSKEIEFEVELRDNYTLTANTQMSLEKQKTEVTEAEAAKRRAIAQAEEEAKQLLLTQGIDNVQAALGALFGESKAVASANVLIDAAQAAVGIINNSQKTGPFAIAYQATQFALLAATTVSSLRQINSAEPGTTGTPDIPGSGTGRLPIFGQGTTTVGGGITATSTPAFGQTAPPVRAYVLTGDVSNGLEAESLLQTRRQFP